MQVFICGLWPCANTDHLNWQISVGSPTKTFVSQKHHWPALPCDMAALYPSLCHSWHHDVNIWAANLYALSHCGVGYRSLKLMFSPLPFSVHGSVGNCTRSVFLESSSRREPLKLFWQNRTAATSRCEHQFCELMAGEKAGPFFPDGYLPTRFHLGLPVSPKNASLRAAVPGWYQEMV